MKYHVRSPAAHHLDHSNKNVALHVALRNFHNDRNGGSNNDDADSATTFVGGQACQDKEKKTVRRYPRRVRFAQDNVNQTFYYHYHQNNNNNNTAQWSCNKEEEEEDCVKADQLWYSLSDIVSFRRALWAQIVAFRARGEENEIENENASATTTTIMTLLSIHQTCCNAEDNDDDDYDDYNLTRTLFHQHNNTDLPPPSRYNNNENYDTFVGLETRGIVGIVLDTKARRQRLRALVQQQQQVDADSDAQQLSFLLSSSFNNSNNTNQKAAAASAANSGATTRMMLAKASAKVSLPSRLYARYVAIAVASSLAEL